MNTHRNTRQAEFRFYEELNDFLPDDKKRKSFTHAFTGNPSVKELIVSLGVPHTQCDLILVGDEPVSFSHRLQGGERVAVFPVFERFDISPANRLRPRPLRRSRFVLDFELKKLGRLLRLAGVDCAYHSELSDLDIIEIASAEKRTILSRNEELLKHGRVTHAYQVQANDPPAQFREIIEAFDLRRSIKPLSRCTECNGQLRIADDSEVMDRLPFTMLATFDDFWQCEQCQHVQWKGSHYVQLATLLEQI
ncbi:MAG: Mut7-C ubiquitin/RNAse domain-containing protein [Gammaproteobacteria bacterium]|nr:Mut7-C ubiquitin/RNAse domain-containing protein [Gammaproteobacteria bacterium]MDH3768259.1 Mut7-C ubiquitin/RNAse domain-containing protein [Gammaproteobacteria bacterium]